MASRGKIVEKWTWRKTGIPPIEVPVRLVRDCDGNHPTFHVSIPSLGFEAKDTDLGNLRKRVFAELDEKYVISWDRYIVVTYRDVNSVSDLQHQVETWDEHFEHHRLDSEEPYSRAHGPSAFEEKTFISFHVEEIELGVYKNGTKCQRGLNSNYVSKDWPELTEDFDEFDRERTVVAMLPSTLENRRALHTIFQDFANLSNNLAKVLHQDKLKDTCQHALLRGTQLALAGPVAPPVVAKKGAKRVVRKKKRAGR